MMASQTVEVNKVPTDDDEWMDWETRHPHVPMWKHMIAGNTY